MVGGSREWLGGSREWLGDGREWLGDGFFWFLASGCESDWEALPPDRLRRQSLQALHNQDLRKQDCKIKRSPVNKGLKPNSTDLRGSDLRLLEEVADLDAHLLVPTASRSVAEAEPPGLAEPGRAWLRGK
ncbi:MAG: hypothetical protein HC899_29810 [Leptolyngbyaceae cyanobacterium SM1_4_3]|nr:hypothetical protein [Leptolyngbyaceae cyanobacterium SM1_4_3]